MAASGVKNAVAPKSVPKSGSGPGGNKKDPAASSGSQVTAAEVAAGLKKAGRAGKRLAIAKHARRGG